MSICFKTFQPTVLLACEMKQKTCGAGKAIGREKPGLGVKYMMTVVLEMVYYCRIFPEMLFSSRINCILEQGQILCSPPLLLITKVSEEAWGSMHLNIFFFSSFSISEVVLVLGALKAAAARPPVSLSASTVAEHSLPWTPTED